MPAGQSQQCQQYDGRENQCIAPVFHCVRAGPSCQWGRCRLPGIRPRHPWPTGNAQRRLERCTRRRQARRPGLRRRTSSPANVQRSGKHGRIARIRVSMWRDASIARQHNTHGIASRLLFASSIQAVRTAGILGGVVHCSLSGRMGVIAAGCANAIPANAMMASVMTMHRMPPVRSSMRRR